MNNEVVTIADKNKTLKEFLKVRIIPVKQKDKVFYVGKVPGKFFLDVYTVEPTQYDVVKESCLAQTFKDDKEYSEFRLDLSRKETEIDEKSFQRRVDNERVKDISKFLNTDDYALFPNAIVVTCDLINDNIEMEISSIQDVADSLCQGDNLVFLEEKSDDEAFLYIPHNKNSLLVIDGQHRLEGLKNSEQKIIDTYELLVSFILGFDRAVVAKLFYTINYTQKSVNRSLLYHLSGEFSHKIDEVTFLHEAVRVLNEIEESPFYQRIKMLGTVVPGTSTELKKRMTVSQAFLIDYLVKSISSEAKTGLYPPIFLPYFQKEDLQVEIIRFLIKYFQAIKNLSTGGWDNPTENMISKTVGVGAFIRVMYFFFAKLVVHDLDGDLSRIKDVTVETLQSKLKGIDRINFSVEGEFGKAASGGTLNKLQKQIIENVSYFGGIGYDDFIADYRSNYLIHFREIIRK